jgi:hypothetical protein
MVRAIRLSIEAVDRQLEEAAKTLGAGPVSVFLVITLPHSVPGIASMILCFARSMGEFGVTITFVSNIPGETQTLPSAIFTLTQVPGGHAGPHTTLRWREMDSNFRFRASGDTPHRPRGEAASHRSGRFRRFRAIFNVSLLQLPISLRHTKEICSGRSRLGPHLDIRVNPSR